MEDADILALYFERNEQALSETRDKYGRLIYTVAYHILHNREDAQECENDTYLGAWNTIPPARPGNLPAYLSGIARNISISRHRARSADKRGGGEVVLSLQELGECVPDSGSMETDTVRLAEALNEFLASLRQIERMVFVCRYWRCDSIDDIAKRFGFGKSRVKMMLLRTRGKLREFLTREGYFHDEQ